MASIPTDTCLAYRLSSRLIWLPYWQLFGMQVELGVSLGPDLQPAKAAVAIDLTARDIQVC